MAVNHNIRSSRKQGFREVRLTPLKAIKFNCIECMGFQENLVPECTDQHCPLYPFRMGKTTVKE